MFEIDQDKLLDEVLALINAEFERPEGSFLVKEITQRARDNGQNIPVETMRGRLEAKVRAGKMEKIPVGKNIYYRIVDERQ